VVPKDLFAQLGKLGIDASTLALAGIALPLCVAGAAFALKYWKAWNARKLAEAPPPTLRPGEPAYVPELATAQLRRAWLGFLRRMPWNYRRSILNFDHFVIFGLAGSGKSRLVEAYTDFRHQMRLVARDAPVDPELPVVLGSGSVVIEVPARFLEDESALARQTLDRLFRPLYREKSPTVVFVLDVRWLAGNPPEVIAGLARSLRVCVNQLASIRRSALELRVALTHLDSLEGIAETARFWSLAGISTRIPLAPQGSHKGALATWDLELQAQLPRTLASLSSDEYRRVIAFARRTGAVLAPLGTFLDALYAPDVMTQTPIAGGVYLATGVPGEANPLESGLAGGPGPDPLKRHAILAAAILGTSAAYLALAFGAQHRAWEPAEHAIEEYEVTKELVGTPREKLERRALMEFSMKSTGLFQRFPDFFDDIREQAREKLSSTLRESLIKPRLIEVARDGILTEDQMRLRWRRTLYYLALIHSYRADRLGIKEPKNLEIWSEMTGLPKDVIRDYLDSTPVPYTEFVHFVLGESAQDEKDRALFWLELPLSIRKAVHDGLLDQNELKVMQDLAGEMRQALSRFKHDATTLAILDDLDFAATEDRPGAAHPHLKDKYKPLFAARIADVTSTNPGKQDTQLKALIKLVEAASVTQERTYLLSELVDRLAVLQATPLPEAESVELKLGGQTFTFLLGEWKELLKNSRAAQLINLFIAGTSESDSIFFAERKDSELRSIVWNELGGDATIFRGTAVLSGRYTRDAFEQRVKTPVTRLVELLGKLRIPPAEEERLYHLVRGEVSKYATLYHAEAMHFLRSYGLRTTSAEGLRVVLGQISAESSTFDDFLQALDENTHLGDDEGGAPASKAAATKNAKPDDKAKAAGPPGKDAHVTEAGGDQVELLLEPIYSALSDFETWHAAVGGAKGTAELGKYKEVVKQLLTDLTSAAEPADKGKGAELSLLEKELTPVGRVTLRALESEGEDPYRALVKEWVRGAGLTPEQSAPFLAPFDELAKLGESDVEAAVARAWSRELLPAIAAIGAKFPFDRDAELTATPDEVAELFHPLDGKFFTLYRGYVQPLSVPPDGKKLRELPAVRERIHLPAELYAVANTASTLAARLWDDKGAPRALEFRVRPIPFERGQSARFAPTMIHLQAGEHSVFNFNQAPAPASLALDWSADESAMVSVQVTDVETNENAFPPALAASGPFWRFLRLLRAGKVTRVRTPLAGELYEWDLRLRELSRERVRARLLVLGDPWAGFSMPRTHTALRAAR
jgi:hypothetical protein